MSECTGLGPPQRDDSEKRCAVLSSGREGGAVLTTPSSWEVPPDKSLSRLKGVMGPIGWILSSSSNDKGLLMTVTPLLSFSSSVNWNLNDNEWYRLSFSSASSLVTNISFTLAGGAAATTGCIGAQASNIGINCLISFNFSSRLENADPHTNFSQYT